MANDYKSTMNLPRTDFPMRANLSVREPERLDSWKKAAAYRRSLEVNEGGETFVLHDGPPYANGDIHMGTAFNKILKDLIVRYKTMRGYVSPYVPGWDCHGQPIEHRVEKDLGPEKMAEITQVELRALCREYALTYVDRQREQFQRLGVRGDFEDPYLTLSPQYEAGNVKVFADLYRKGMIYHGRKPIHWCYHCKTALAEAEIEYGNETSDSIYVRFRLTDKPEAWATLKEPMSVLIWTTTPWTLPANVAVTLAASADYVAVRVGDEIVVLAEELVEQVAEIVDWGDHEILEPRLKGRDLAGLTYEHVVHDGGTGVIVTGEYVDLTTGTGVVHTAPGHGDEDHLIGLEHGLPAPMPVDDDGVFDEGGGPFEGMLVDDANPAVVDFLRKTRALVHADKMEHSYPHCWRCKKPVIFRATEQWFISMDEGDIGSGDGLRAGALKAIDSVDWVPSWSVKRIGSMVAGRPDWCISRQRAWGVPIPVFHCKTCGGVVVNDTTFAAVEELFATEGSDAWFIKEPSEYLPKEVSCPSCGGTELVPESDIIDVWFESGVSHESVLREHEDLHWPADLYLEGSDQHRGWFQSSLMTSVGVYGRAPYDTVLTHGYIVDGDGRKMSKSLGNVVDPLEVIEMYGADVIRLWVASGDYSRDMSVSDEILKQSADAYRKIRNTFRFLLSNLYDYDPSMAVSWAEMPEFDRYALVHLADLLERVTTSYDAWRYHHVFRAVYEYCVTDLSAFYLDVLKDRLYSDATDSVSRRSAQTVLARVVVSLARVLAPILVFTTDEVWSFLPEGLREGVESVHLAGWPEVADILSGIPDDEAEELRRVYGILIEYRDAVLKQLEGKRGGAWLKKSQEADVELKAPSVHYDVLHEREQTLADIFIVSRLRVTKDLDADASKGEMMWTVSLAVDFKRHKCPRCWNFRELGVDRDHPDVCERCAEVLART